MKLKHDNHAAGFLNRINRYRTGTPIARSFNAIIKRKDWEIMLSPRI